jgi:3-oxoacyl-[acyl-carrier-protein] synthase II
MPEDFVAAVQKCTNDDDSFDFSRWGTDGIQHIAPLWLLTCLPNMPACQIAILNNLCGPNNSITERDVSANLAVAEARNLIVDDDVDVVIAGATGTTICPMNMIHMLSETEVSPGGADPTKVCRPFDRHRNGTVVGEGAAAIVLEEMSAAIRRGAPIYGEVLGYGSSCVAGRSGEGHCSAALANAMHAALRRHRVSPREVGHINAHGLSTRRSDVDEARGIRALFGSYADRMPVVAAKGHLGNAGAGSGAMELVASLLALRHGRLFPVLNYETPDRECPIAPVISSNVEAGKSFLNLSMTPNGHASCLLIGALN